MGRIRITVTVNRMRRYCRDWTLLRKLVEELLDGARYSAGPSAVRFLQAIHEEICRREEDFAQRQES